jgi:hypothetical protein
MLLRNMARTRRFIIGLYGGQKTGYLNAFLKNWQGPMPKADAGRQGVLMIDATHLKVYRTASSLKKEGDEPRLIGRTKGGMNTKLHTLCDKQGRPIRLHITEGQRSNYKGADVLPKDLPRLKRC